MGVVEVVVVCGGVVVVGVVVVFDPILDGVDVVVVALEEEDVATAAAAVFLGYGIISSGVGDAVVVRMSIIPAHGIRENADAAMEDGVVVFCLSLLLLVHGDWSVAEGDDKVHGNPLERSGLFCCCCCCGFACGWGLLRWDDAGRFWGVVVLDADDRFPEEEDGVVLGVDDDDDRLKMFLFSMSPMIVFCVDLDSPMILPI